MIGNGYNFAPPVKDPAQKNLEPKKEAENLPTATKPNTLVSNNAGNGSNFNTYDIPTTAQYVGNSSKKKLHLGSCGSTKKIAPHNRVIFSSREEAINAGYVPCKRCNP